LIGTVGTASKKKALSWLALTMIIANVGLLSAAALALYFFGSLAPAVAYLRGDRLIADAYTRSLGTIRKGEERAAFFVLTNSSNRAVKILGSRASCTCLVVDELPVALPPHGVFRLRIGLRPRVKPGQIAERVSLFTDREGEERLELKISGRVVESGGSSAASN
jgi:Protein of unknown function (DUF1573)